MTSWKPVTEYEGLYEVSACGKVRSLDRCVGKNTPYLKKGRELKQKTDKDGYKQVGFTVKGAVRSFQVHRVVARAFISNEMNKPCINHVDAVKSNNAASNLEWCSHQENMSHASRMGLLKRSSSASGISPV